MMIGQVLQFCFVPEIVGCWNRLFEKRSLLLATIKDSFLETIEINLYIKAIDSPLNWKDTV